MQRVQAYSRFRENMEERLVKQANGKLCLFSFLCPKEFSKSNLTEQDYIDLRVQDAIRKAKEDIERATTFHKIKVDFHPEDDKDIEGIEALLKETGDEGLTTAERERYKGFVESAKAFREMYEGYFH